MKRRIAASFLVWLAAVAFVASIAWLAIDTAGRQVTSAQAAAPLPTDGQTPTRTPSAESTMKAVVKHKKAATHPATPSATTTTTRPAPPPVTASPVSSTYASNVGRVRVVCTGATISLQGGYAQPASGWALRIQEQSSNRIVISFYSPGHMSLTLAADCSQGQPRFYAHKVNPRSPHPNPTGTPTNR